MRPIWKEHKTGITLFVGSILTLLYGSIQINLKAISEWNGYASIQDIIGHTSQFVPVAAAIVTFIAGVVDMTLWFSDGERKRLKDENKRLKKQLKTESKAEVIVEIRKLQSQWEKWEKNGRDPDKKPKLPKGL